MIPHIEELKQPFTLNNAVASELAIKQWMYNEGALSHYKFYSSVEAIFSGLWEAAHGNDFEHDVHREPWQPYVPLIPVEQWGC